MNSRAYIYSNISRALKHLKEDRAKKLFERDGSKKSKTGFILEVIGNKNRSLCFYPDFYKFNKYYENSSDIMKYIEKEIFEKELEMEKDCDYRAIFLKWDDIDLVNLEIYNNILGVSYVAKIKLKGKNKRMRIRKKGRIGKK